MRLRAAAVAVLAAAALVGCETLPEEEPRVPAPLPPPYYGTPPPPVYYGPPPVVFYEYYYDPFWYPYRFFPGPVIVVPEGPSAPPRVRPLPRGGAGVGGGAAVPAPTPPSAPAPRVRPRP